MAYDPLHHKYRPQTFGDLVGQTAIAETLSNAMEQERIVPAYLFTGPRGTGKTSSARILAKSLNCLQAARPTATPCGVCNTCRAIAIGTALDVIEIDAASNTGVDNIRELIERAQFAPVQCRYKVYVIDECHMLSVAAFNALLKTLEEPPERVVFVLATTDPQRVLPTIISRCQRFDYRRIPLDAMVQHLGWIATQEGINIDPAALTLVAQIANGGLRDAESLLDQLSLLPGLITADKVWDLVGAVPEQDLLTLLTAIASDQAETLLSTCRQILNRGREPLIVLQNLAAFYLNLLIAKTAPQRLDLVAVTQPTWQQLCELAPNWAMPTILQGQQRLKDSEVQLRNTTQPRLWLEVTLLNLLPSAYATVESPRTQAAPAQRPISTPFPATNTAAPTAPPRVTPPPSEPIPVTVSPEPKTEPEAVTPTLPSAPPASRDLAQTWSAVLAELTTLTQALVKAHGMLEKFEGNTAWVGIKTEALLKLAQGKVKELEAAFAQVCGTTIRVQLLVVGQSVSTNSIAPASPSSPPPRPPVSSAPTPSSPVTATAVASPPVKASTIPPPTAPTEPSRPAPEPQSLHRSPAGSSPSPPPSVSTTPVPPVEPIDPSESLTDSPTRKALEQFAKNFDGEIIESEATPESNEASSAPPQRNMPPESREDLRWI